MSFRSTIVMDTIVLAFVLQLDNLSDSVLFYNKYKIILLMVSVTEKFTK